MKLAGHTMGMPELDVFECLDLMGDCGWEGLEIRVAKDGQLDDKTYSKDLGRRVLERARERNVEICCLTSYYKNFYDPEAREAEIDGLRRVIDMAVDLACPIVRAYGGPEIPDGEDIEAGRDRIAEGLRRVADYAAERGVRVAIETHGFTSTSSATEMRDMLDRVDHPNLGVLLDYAWIFQRGEETVAEAFDLLGGRILHCHVKDYPMSGPGEEFGLMVPLGEGGVPWREVLAALMRTGYRGYLCDEYEKYWKPELPEPADWFPRNGEAIRGLVKQAAGDGEGA